MSRDPFPGFPAFLERAARSLGLDGVALLPRRIAPLTALAELCGQASMAEPDRAAAILAKAGEFRDQLRVALAAAELMLAESGGPPAPTPAPAEVAPPAARRRAAPNPSPRTT